MNIQISAKNYVVSDKLRNIIEKKVEKLERYFSERAEVKIFCRKENDLCKLELTIKDGGLLFRSEVFGDSMYQNIDMALPKVEKQIIKYSSKLKDKLYKKTAIDERDWLYFEEDKDVLPSIDSVIKTKKFDIVPLTVEDAEMYLENSDHAFYVYLNNETGKVNIMYKRKMGGFGIIEPQY